MAKNKSNTDKKQAKKTEKQRRSALGVSTGKKGSDEAKAGRYRSFRLEKRKKHEAGTRFSGSFRLAADSASFFTQHYKIFGGISLIYFILTAVFVGLGSDTNLTELKDGLSELLGDGFAQLGVGLALFASLVGTTGAPAEGNGMVQGALAIIVSLAVIWISRQLMSGRKVGIRDGFYKGMYPLVPVLLVVLAIGLQLIPMAIASFLFSAVFAGGLAINLLEKAVWAVLIFLLILLSLYMLTSSVMAFYIATLPDMRPMQALRSARELVRHRRFSVMRRLLFLPFLILVISASITLPFIWVLPATAQWVFLAISMTSLVYSHIYLYSLYKELL